MSKAHVIKHGDLQFQHRGGPPGSAAVARAIGPDTSDSMAAGFARFDGCRIDWTLLYDEVVVVIEGTFRVQTPDGVLEGRPGDVLWLPDGTELQYQGDQALIFYAVHPGDWKERFGIEPS
ncbi:ethanolamine utilization protein EutQ [Marinobacterium arenosum]|uniref:ethanolamine utilization protein EutQ n=1 Tax=Marinobacterium arenosum TaxID=2862496 RepID=UPI001C98D078|nr:ethanolamine utilization protein EutQ [Marinobacterium arenosum]MBY4675165.1 ethanolamine utilization protein EutQ [Marinobacterium arenosum]